MYLKNEIYKMDLAAAFGGIMNVKKLYHKNVLITGATGLIGSFVADVLLYANRIECASIEIYLLARDEKRLRDRFVSSIGEGRLHLIIQDVVNPLCTDVCFDYVIHSAGDGFPAAFREHPVQTMTPALFGTYQLLQYVLRQDRLHPLQKFLYISSGEVYGNTQRATTALMEEDNGYIDSMSVRACYPMAKRCAETLCVAFGEQYKVPVVIARPSHTYGACTSGRDNRASVQFLNDTVMGKNIVLYSNGRQLRSYTYVADCVAGIFTILLNGENGEAYNIANVASRATIAEFANILSQKAGTTCIIKNPSEDERKEYTPIEYAVLDSSKLEQLGWRGQYDLTRGIECMFAIKKEMVDQTGMGGLDGFR